MRNTDKTGGYDQTRIKDYLIPMIESGFNNTGISFEFVCEVNYINNTDLRQLGVGIGGQPFSFCDWSNQDPNILQLHSDGIDIFIADGGRGAGRVNSIPGKFTVLGNNSMVGDYNSLEETTVVHELGHIFGLTHMSRGARQNPSFFPPGTCSNYTPPYGECYTGCSPTAIIDCGSMSYVFDNDACAEHSGNGAISGDLIPDTPPSDERAEFLVNQTCSTNPTYVPLGQYVASDGSIYDYDVLDPTGQIYQPLVTNYMSTISQKECRDHFTDNQITVMKNHIANHPALQFIQSDPNELICECDYDKIIYLREDANWSDVIIDYEINSLPLVDYEIVVQKNLNFDTDYKFTNATFTMGDNANIIVEAGNTLTVDGGTFSACGTRWGEIYLESSAGLDFLNVDMSKGTNAIRTENNPYNTIGKSDITVHSSTIDDFSESGITIFTSSEVSLQGIGITKVVDYGINLANDVDAEVLIGIDIDGADRGIRIINSPFWHQINDCTFTNCHIGVRYNGTSGSIHDSDFGKTNFGVTVHNSAHSFIYRNNIGYGSNGITVSKSSNTNINRNNIGLPDNYGNFAILLSNVSGGKIEGNPSMYARKFGIKGDFLTDVDVTAWRDDLDPANPVLSSNNIYVQGTQNTNSGGILYTVASDCDITDNYIHAREVAVGIEMNNSPGNFINNNFVSISSIPNLFRSAAIRNVGSMSMTVNENETYSSDNANGILAQNSANGSYECNFIYDTHDAFCIEHHSASQFLKANHQINSHGYDFVTRSVLGLQLNLGNEYWEGSVLASFNEETEDNDILNSRFLVDATDPYHLPTNPDPANGWFDNNGLNDKNCTGSNIGPGGAGTFFSNPVKLCEYWNSIKALKEKDPQLFLIKVAHIISYFNANPLMAIPDCIELDPDFINLCGIHELMDIVDRIIKVGKINPSRSALEGAINKMSQLQREYEALTNQVSRENKYRELKKLHSKSKPAFDQEAMADHTEIQNIKSDLGRINCSQHMIQVIKDVWTVYLDELDEDLLDANPRLASNINTISRLCSDEFGDAIHLARSIALSQGNDDYLDNNDGCQDRTKAKSRSTTDSSDKLSFSIYPNPSIGNVQFEFNTTTSGLLQIFNTRGEQILISKIENKAHIAIDIENNGIYIGHFTSSEGYILTQKIIIVK